MNHLHEQLCKINIMNLKTKIKLGSAISLVILLAVFIGMNMQPVEVDFLIAKVEIRRSLMILITFLIGLFSGWALHSAFAHKRNKNKAL
ncbi:MAG: putative integral membrane protein [Paracoccaceae bacterium]|jgi:uncharacterized integral membrane protein